MRNNSVTLKTFLGTVTPKNDTEERENYWKLIGKRGQVIDDNRDGDRVLVLFEVELDAYKFENHNPIKNSLWISVSDLEIE
jgi:hypothetical protein